MNRSYLKHSVALLALFSVWSPPAHAYLDPGTGSILLQGLIATVAGAIVAARLYWQRVKTYVAGLMPGNKTTEEPLAETAAESDDAR